MKSNQKEKRQNKEDKNKEKEWLKFIKKNTGKIKTTEAFIRSVIAYNKQKRCPDPYV